MRTRSPARLIVALSIAGALAVFLLYTAIAGSGTATIKPSQLTAGRRVQLVGQVIGQPKGDSYTAGGLGFSITAMMGILMVVGIAVSNGILLIDEANRRFNDGADRVTAVVAAARIRFIPIAMTSLATIIGLLPTALGLEAGTEANRPLALAVVGGLASSTVLSLFLVPTMFTLIAKRAPEPEAAPAPLAPMATHP